MISSVFSLSCICLVTGLWISNIPRYFLFHEATLWWMLNDIPIVDQLQWLPYRSNFSPISWPWYRPSPSPKYEWYPWNICNGWGMLHCSRERLPFRTPYPVTFWTGFCSKRWDLPCLFPTFHLGFWLSWFCYFNSLRNVTGLWISNISRNLYFA